MTACMARVQFVNFDGVCGTAAGLVQAKHVLQWLIVAEVDLKRADHYYVLVS